MKFSNTPFVVSKNANNLYDVGIETRPTDEKFVFERILLFHDIPEELAMDLYYRLNDALLYYLEENWIK